MKKVILSLAILMATSVSTFALSGNNDDNNKCKKTENVCKDKKDGKDKKSRKDKGGNMFEGLNLTHEQQNKLEDLKKARKAEMEKMKGERKANPEKREKLTEEQKKQMRAEGMAKREAAKQQYLDDIKKILTPEQYEKFLENNFKKSDGPRDGRKFDGPRDSHKFGGKRGDKKADTSEIKSA